MLNLWEEIKVVVATDWTHRIQEALLTRYSNLVRDRQYLLGISLLKVTRASMTIMWQIAISLLRPVSKFCQTLNRSQLLRKHHPKRRPLLLRLAMVHVAILCSETSQNQRVQEVDQTIIKVTTKFSSQINLWFPFWTTTTTKVQETQATPAKESKITRWYWSMTKQRASHKHQFIIRRITWKREA